MTNCNLSREKEEGIFLQIMKVMLIANLYTEAYPSSLFLRYMIESGDENIYFEKGKLYCGKVELNLDK